MNVTWSRVAPATRLLIDVSAPPWYEARHFLRLAVLEALFQGRNQRLCVGGSVIDPGEAQAWFAGA